MATLAPFTHRPIRKLGLYSLLLLLLFSGFSTPAQAQSLDGPSPRIIGGVAADPSDYPWAVALLRANVTDPFNAQFCGGSLIADRWVLTAAHCVEDFSSASNLEVAVGIANLDSISNSDRIVVNNIFVHPNYDAVLQDNDIALLELATASSNATLALANNALTDSIYADTNSMMTIIGWGATTTPVTSTSFPLLLQEVEIPPYDFSRCRDIYGRTLTSNMICASGTPAGGLDTCQGDSGGPMLYQEAGTWRLIGITSFGTATCAQPKIPGGYTRVANYLDWISGTLTFASAFPDGYQFGYHGAGVAPTQILTLTNNSGADITVADVSLATMTNFSITGQNCTTGSIANNASCTISLQFLTTGSGKQFDTLNIVLSTSTSFSATVSGTVLSEISAGPALDETPAHIWYSGGDGASPNWFSDGVANSNGGTAMRSGYIDDNQDSVLFSYFTEPTLSYRWKSSSEQGFDSLKLYVDGVLTASISGNRDWGQCSLNLSAGEHRVAWVYEKDSSISEFQDAVWLDSVNTTYSGESAACAGKLIINSTGGGGGGGSVGKFLLLLLIVMLGWQKAGQQNLPSSLLRCGKPCRNIS